MADILDTYANPVQVIGEVGSFLQAASGHCYFNLKDADAQLRCVMFRRTGMALSALPKNGDMVEVVARVGLHAARGDLQLIVEDLRPAGQGSRMEEFLRRKAALEAEGLFSVSRKRALPDYPGCVGVVTSLDAAALSDVLTALARRAPHIEVVISPCTVQGADAEQSIISALELLYGRCGPARDAGSGVPEVVLLVRGGGAWEDLHAFNETGLAYCIARSPVPVISGVGHETDFTIADFVADVRAATPTAAAELCASPREETLQRLDEQAYRMHKAVASKFQSGAQQLDWMGAILARPADGVAAMSSRITQLEQSLRQSVAPGVQAASALLGAHAAAMTVAIERKLERAEARLAGAGQRLEASDPKAVLSRGFAWMEGPKGLVTSVRQVAVGDSVRATLADGVVELGVLGIED